MTKCTLCDRLGFLSAERGERIETWCNCDFGKERMSEAKCTRCDHTGHVHYEAMGEQCYSWCSCAFAKARKRRADELWCQIKKLEAEREMLFR